MSEQEIPKPFVIEVTPEQSKIVQETVSNILGELPVWGNGRFVSCLDEPFLYWKGFAENDNTFTHSNSLSESEEDEKIYEKINFNQFCERYVESKPIKSIEEQQKEYKEINMSEQEKNQEALKQLGIEIPEGWEFVRYGIPKINESYLEANNNGIKTTTTGRMDRGGRFIIKKKIETECWYLVEDMQKDRAVKLLDDKYRWVTYTNPNYLTQHFNDYKIISKMVVEK